METKYLILALMTTYCQSSALSHILTEIHEDLPLPACMQVLKSTVMEELCPIYSELSSDHVDEMQIVSKDRWYARQRIIRKCCSMPCSINELLYMC